MNENESVDALRVRLSEADAECRRLRAENAQMRQRLETTARMTNTGAPSDAPVMRHETSDAADHLITELQRRLWDALQRNAFLEQNSHAEHNALIQTYEGYIKRLEDELHRCQLLLQTSASGALSASVGE
ncbi:hypothetical protein DQ04_00511120 [Trypanosoma grayi]|uniref:hypothetical protein n=1 Tax=Trypanosoma grayi TaxID=71804 RepID=UPI0004F44D17|nr:hypothetical protein DQ04_00511120 [Trypanosoma grayi]KEG14349.1 hypothetical protein DQ04_00511120 [Trypanosoma grayi]